jgi:prolyl oligopeptidase PreP (S9A serine peptidase family)
MKKSLLGLLVAVTTFFFGILIQSLSQPNPVFVIEESVPIQNFISPRDSVSRDEIKIETNSGKEFSILEGDYYLDRDSHISLYLVSMNDNERLIVSGAVGDEKNFYEIDTLNQNYLDPINKKIQFKTNKVKGIWYEFEGNFIKSDYNEGEKVLSGKLRKLKKGKLIKKIEGSYTFYYHVCGQ